MLRASFILVLTIVQRRPMAYNIDVLNAKVYDDPARVSGGRRSYFGFSVALYTSPRESLLLVGAPRANSSGLPLVTEPGIVFKCSMNGVCEEWAIDKTGNGPRPRERLVHQLKDNAWIGATVVVENRTEPRVVVCGPRWINNIVNGNRPNWLMNGICYTTRITDADVFEREAEELLLPLSNPEGQTTSKNNIGIYNYGMGQIGFSLHVNSLGDDARVTFGAPGVYNWKGDAILITTSLDGSFSRTIIPSLAREQQVHSYNYFGYAVTAGTYFNEQDTWYASSAPKSANMYGKILVFAFPPKTNQRMFIKMVIHGQRYGEFFGAALTSCDVNNDRRHELIVGAPQWSKDMDEGLVYIFTGQRNNNFEELQTIEGEVVGGRFGSAVACLGDIDYDGYGDIAVGAPYEDESGGAVYVFNGNRDGVSRRYSQRLIGTRFSPTMRGFGISISEPRDVDRDNYSDVAVGAYLSGEVVLLRSAPVVTVNVTLTYPQVRLLRNSTSFLIDIWMSYEGAYVPQYLRSIAILKVDQLHGRATYRAQRSNDGSQTYKLPYTLSKSTVAHNSLEIHLTENIGNIIDPLEISVSMQLEDDLDARNGSSSSCVACVVINKHRSKMEDLVKLPFAVDCGEDNVCVSDLRVALSIDSTRGDRYTIGSAPTITLRVDAYNHGEPAYQTRVRVFTETLPLASVPPECTENPGDVLEVTCDIGNPLRTNKTLTLQLDTSAIRYDVGQVELWANISTQSDEANWDDNSHAITVYFDVDVDIAIAGKAQENLYSYLRNEENGMRLNSVRFQHFYEVQKFGASPIEEAVLTVKIPTHIRQSHDAADVAIVSINDTTGRMDAYQFYCSDSNETDDGLSIASKQMADNVILLSPENKTYARFSIEEDTPMNLPSENRTLYINCTNDAVECAKIDCRLGPFLSSLSVAKFLITLDLQLSNFPADLMKNKDIVFYVTEGSVTITGPHLNITQREGHKPDTVLVATTFLGSPVAQRIAVWIIALSVILGIALLILLILGLIKIGFFNRRKKMELEALKAETDVCLAFSE
ncbi:integrin alpha-4-like isoform X2 [Camponotus floridanus]|uniref:integrin alpha-4-like isoform X2 n=1 Tax=Camponotus floridanus TaxID=104421 RepID=UPI000DC6C974|nr:integrin alpha-4-like isoform X2 [Camponotus floridanus]